MKTVKLSLASGAVLAVLMFFGRDSWLAYLTEEVIHHQAMAVLDQQVQLGSLRLNSSNGRMHLEKVSLTQSGDPRQLAAFKANRVKLDIDVEGIVSPNIRIRNARVYDADIVLEYVAPGVSNFKIMERQYRERARKRKAAGRSRLVEWDIDALELHRVNFTLIDIDGETLAEVQIPKITTSMVRSRNTGSENLALLFRDIQTSVLSETIKGRVDGNYDIERLALFVKRELPNAELLPAGQVEKLKDAGKTLLKQFLR